MKVRLATPADDDHCGWLAPFAAERLTSPLEGERIVEVAIVGAGLTGLAAARDLAERGGGRIALVEAQRAGWGASGRASGFVVDLAHFVARFPPADQERYVRLARAGIAELRETVRRSRIDCDWDETGWLHVAWSEAGAAEVARLRRWLEKRDEPHQPLDREGLAEVTGVPFYRAGIRLPGSVLVQAGALVRGLARHLPAAVDLYEETPVLSLTRLRDGWHLETPGGRLRAERVLLAVNGYSRGIPGLARRVLPLLTFGSLTRPLTAVEQARLGGEREWGVLAEDAMGSTVRRTRDGRILVRNHVAYRPGLAARPADLETARARHRLAFDLRFPMLTEVAFETTWTGVMGVTPARLPFFGELAPGLWAAGGYTGAGIALGTVLGRLLAEAALDQPSSLLADARALAVPRRLPPEPILSWGATWKVRRMNRNTGSAV
ncbi:MAG TPA: FAD-binding oxidoreductase [Thermoanaerobaculia bacterium]|nr:FAD-binding oxidoreductase [Thermoanaerobaculia bacterium]